MHPPSWPIRLLTNTTVHAKGGQVQQKFWRYDADFKSDATFWQWAAPPSWPIRLLTNTTVHGKGGQVQHKFWRYDYDLKSEAGWQARLTYNLSLFATLEFSDSPSRQFFPPDEASVWRWQASRNKNLLDAVAVQPFVSKAWHYDYDDGSVWQWRVPANLALASSYISLGPVNVRYSQPDDASVWQWQVPFNPNLFTVTVAAPFTAPQRLFLSDDASVWQWQPPAQPSVFYRQVLPRPSGQWHYDFDAASVWASAPLPQPKVFYDQTKPVVPPQWGNAFRDDAAFWQWQVPARTIALTSFIAGIRDNWRQVDYGYDQAAFWTGTPVASGTIAQLRFAPTSPTKQWHYDYDDASGWTGTGLPPSLSLLNSLVVSNPFFSKAWHTNDIDEPGSWQWYYQNIQNILSTSVTPTAVGHYEIDPLWIEWWQTQAQKERERGYKKRRKQELAEIEEERAEIFTPRRHPRLRPETLARIEKSRTRSDIEHLIGDLRGLEAKIVKQMLHRYRRFEEDEEEAIEMLLLS